MVLQTCNRSATGPQGGLPVASLRPSAQGPAEQNGYNSSLLPHSLRDPAAFSPPTSPAGEEPGLRESRGQSGGQLDNLGSIPLMFPAM